MSQDKNKDKPRSRPRNWGQNGRRWEPLEEARRLQQQIDEQIAINEQSQEAHDAGYHVVVPQAGLQSRDDPLRANPSHYFEENAKRRARSSNQDAQGQPTAKRRGQPEDIFRIGAGRANHGQRLTQPTLPQLAIDNNLTTPHNPNREGLQRRTEAVRRAQLIRALQQENQNNGFSEHNISGSEAARQRAEAAAEQLAARHRKQVTGTKPDFRPPPTQTQTQQPTNTATNPQARRPGPGQPTPTPMEIEDDQDQDVPMGPNVQERAQPGNNIGRQGALQSGGATKYNYLPRSINEKYFTLSFQRMVRYDLMSRAETFGSLASTGWGTHWNGGPATIRTSEWRFIPNQTWEMYLTPVQSRQIMDLCGWGGEIKPERCGIHVMNTRLAMQLPQETGYLITVDKPYFKVYEDKPRELFGHGYIGEVAADIAPSANAIIEASTHFNRQNLEPIGLPSYFHTVPGVITESAQTLTDTQLNLESSGGIEFYQPGDTFAKTWDLSGVDFTPIQGLSATGINIQLNTQNGTAASTLRGHLGYVLGDKNVTRYSTDEAKTLTRDASRAGIGPNMVLITIPDVNSVNIGGGDFSITSELQMNITYDIVVTVHRYDDPNFNAGITTVGPTGVQVVTAAEAYKYMRRQRGDGVYASSRPEIGAYTI